MLAIAPWPCLTGWPEREAPRAGRRGHARVCKFKTCVSSHFARSRLSARASPVRAYRWSPKSPLAEQAPFLTVRDEWTGRAVTLVVRGDIDITTVTTLRNCLDHVLARHPGQLIIDLAAVSFLDCQAVHAFTDIRHALPPSCPMTLRTPQLPARRVLELTGLTSICPIE